MLHCIVMYPRFRKQEATYKWTRSAAEISREVMFFSELESKGDFCLKYKFSLCWEVPFFPTRNKFGDCQ